MIAPVAPVPDPGLGPGSGTWQVCGSERYGTPLLPSGQPARPSDELSTRGQQVLRLVTKGLANKQIARYLGISESTVKAHISSVFRRIGVADRTSAAIWDREHLPDRTAGAPASQET